jgi:hypothetical protein
MFHRVAAALIATTIAIRAVVTEIVTAGPTRDALRVLERSANYSEDKALLPLNGIARRSTS